MKKAVTIITFVLMTLLSFQANAQDAVKTGAKGGLNFATMSDGYDSRTGFVVGGFAKFGIPDSPLSIQPEIMYSQQGGKVDNNEVRIDYLQIPVLFKFAMNQNTTVEPNLFAGPYAGLRLLAEQDGGTGGLFGGSTNIESQTEQVDYGLSFGGGVDIEVGNSIFTMDARYNFGLANAFTDRDGKHRVFAITFGISLPSSSN
ncbi:porin family protein [Rhodohalobacter halophilus]|uniref:porin family protein n=1 Tax=Rhodohalobacter halophilus TaxID=1812810 RepID=UPI00083F7A03|nr:porin family protein [Rhodohalobacter halophilus]